MSWFNWPSRFEWIKCLAREINISNGFLIIHIILLQSCYKDNDIVKGSCVFLIQTEASHISSAIKVVIYKSNDYSIHKSDPVLIPIIFYKYFLNNEFPLLGYDDKATISP